MSRSAKRERTHSDRIRLYEPIYRECMKNRDKSPPKMAEIKKPDHIIKSNRKVKKPESLSLNSYQKFVQEENKKEKYINLTGKNRLQKIASEWTRKKRKDNKKCLKETVLSINGITSKRT